jgi:hypothetical protein
VAYRFYFSALAGVLLGSCGTMAWAAAPSDDRPLLELRAGENYFRAGGRPVFVLGRNPAATSAQGYVDHFRHAAAAGERFMRIHFTFSPPGEKAGQIDAGMLKGWDAVLDAAEEQGLAVMPVLGVWADWNDGSRHELWHRWEKNAFNTARGGPAQRPEELFADGPCRRLWLQRLETFVQHWSHRHAIVAWEMFSELDLVTGADEGRAVEFVERAAAVVRAADPWKRPVTASLAGARQWPKFLQCDAMAFNEVHLYPGGPLDEAILQAIPARRAKYGKPVLLGECGLDWRPPPGTLDAAPRAEVGVRHAIWASVVSGAMNGRMLWWQDGYDLFQKADLCRHYQQAAATAAAFVVSVDFSDFAPVPCDLPATLKGALIGNATTRLGWFRDAKCCPPDWPVKPLAGQPVTLIAPGNSWQVEFIDPATGKSLGESRMSVVDQRLRIALVEFQGSIALKLKRLAP